ncbi:histidinol-phosphate transaminase [Buchnera aphidicola (Takecallis taiwana)]|uniref:histidinol-phosphate transaminase n=1 Tax=Buchnera aphidicola TaxID=9 RepID=UPI0031B6C9C8
MENSIQKLSRKDIVFLKAYQSARSIGGIGHTLLNANELPVFNTYSIKNVIVNRYPECQPKEVILQYSDYVNLHVGNILVSRGSDEAIELLMRVFCIPYRDAIMTFSPTYTMYSKIAEIYGIKNVIVPMINNVSLNFSKIKKTLHLVKIIYICRPNNPTGHILDIDSIIKILTYTVGKTIVVIDEAYIEFCMRENIVFLLKRFVHLVILRTLSKAFGLAGIRCGFTLAHKDIIKLLSKIITPYPLPVPSINIAKQALLPSAIFDMKHRVLQLQENKIYLLRFLKKSDLVQYIFHSETNYILVQFYNAKNIFDVLWSQGIILRNQTHEPSLQECIRISVGTKKECLRLISALKIISLN